MSPPHPPFLPPPIPCGFSLYPLCYLCFLCFISLFSLMHFLLSLILNLHLFLTVFLSSAALLRLTSLLFLLLSPRLHHSSSSSLLHLLHHISSKHLSPSPPPFYFYYIFPFFLCFRLSALASLHSIFPPMHCFFSCFLIFFLMSHFICIYILSISYPFTLPTFFTPPFLYFLPVQSPPVFCIPFSVQSFLFFFFFFFATTFFPLVWHHPSCTDFYQYLQMLSSFSSLCRFIFIICILVRFVFLLLFSPIKKKNPLYFVFLPLFSTPCFFVQCDSYFHILFLFCLFLFLGNF